MSLTKTLPPEIGIIARQDAFDDLRTTSKDLIVVDAFPGWCGPCKPLRFIADQYSDVKFVAVNTTTVFVPDMSGNRLPETSQPTFVLLMNDRVFEVLRGFDAKELKAAIERFWALRAAAVTTGAELLSFFPPHVSQPPSPVATTSGRRRSLVEETLAKPAPKPRFIADHNPRTPMTLRTPLTTRPSTMLPTSSPSRPRHTRRLSL